MLTFRHKFPGTLFLTACMAMALSCQPKQPDTKTMLYAPLPNMIFDLNQVNDNNRPIAEAFEAYEKQDYLLAQHRFEGLPEELKTPDIYFYLGMSLFAQGKYSDSKGPLTTGGKYGSRFSGAAKYYLVIVDYEIGRKERAFERLKDLLYRDQLLDYTEKGQKLLEYLALDPEIPENRDN